MSIITAIVVCMSMWSSLAHVLQLLDVDNWQKHKHLTGFSSFFAALYMFNSSSSWGISAWFSLSKKKKTFYVADIKSFIYFWKEKKIYLLLTIAHTLKMEILRSSHIHVSHIYSTGYLHLWLNKHRHQMATSDCLIKVFFYLLFLSTRLFHI